MDIDAAMAAAQEKLSSTEESIPEPVETPAEAAPEPVETTAPESDPKPAAADRARDESGRFAKAGEKPAEKKTAAAPKGGANGAATVAPPAVQGKPVGAALPPASTGQPAPEQKPSAPAVKAPQSWKPHVRELAAKLPAEYRPILEEADRREKETARVLQESAEARRTAETVQRTLAPYETIARANGMDAMSYAGNVLQSAAVLQMGTPQQKAAVVAQIIGSYGVDVQTLAAMLDGKVPGAAQPQQPDVSRIVQQEIERREQETRAREAQQLWHDFQASNPEFLEDVKGDMALILEKAGRERRNITYQQAYDQACRMNDAVRDVLAQREASKKAAEAVRTAQPVTDEQRRAASSPRTQPASRPSVPGKGLEAAMSAARKKLGM